MILDELIPAISQATEREITVLQPGVYLSDGGLAHYLRSIYNRTTGLKIFEIWDYCFDDAKVALYKKTGNLRESNEAYPKNEYGVADNVEQVLSHFKEELDDPDTAYIIGAFWVTKNGQPIGGWRWEKWGPYIGKQEPLAQYIRDEPVIESVLVYHLYRIEENIQSPRGRT